jgi:uncharacterized membrane protein
MISFIEPLALLALLVVPLLWLPLLVRGRGTPLRRRERAGLALRCAAAAALAFALAGTQLLLPVRTMTVIFLLDVSQSVAPGQRERAEAYVRAALAELPPGDRAGLVVFGQHALVARLPGPERALGALGALPGAERTSIAEAIRLALGLLPPEGQRRLVLLSDGAQNSGDALQAAQAAAARGVALEVVPLAGGGADDARISGVALPARLRESTRPRMTVSTQAGRPVAARVVVLDNGAPVLERRVTLPAGKSQLELELPEAQPAYNRYEVRLEAPGDPVPENNTARTFSIVEGRPRVLLVEGRPGEAGALAGALAAARIQAQTVAPAELPDSLAGLGAYDAVLLVNAPLRALPPLAAGLLPAYVRELGRGLAMVGGDRSFGAGGYAGSPVEEALPVRADLEPELERQPVAVAVLIDISGSMAIEENGTRKVQLAAAGAARVAVHIRDDDELTVIPFDSTPHNVIGPLPGSRRDTIIERLRDVQTEGSGITIFDGLTAAHDLLERSPKPVRHLVTITDGDDTTQRSGAAELVERMRGEGITVSTIAIGAGDAVAFLDDLARRGGGRAFLTDRAGDVPDLMLDDLRQIARPYLVEQSVAPQLAAGQADAGVLMGLDGLPGLRGYVATTPRPRAEVLLAAPGGDPLLATWQYGLGRALAWTSSFDGRWAGDLLRWRQFPQLAAQLVGWVAPPPGSPLMAVEARADGDQLRLSAHFPGEKAGGGLAVAGQVVGSDGVRHPVALRQAGPGRYEALLGGLPPDVYQVQLAATRPDGQPVGAALSGAVVDGGAELNLPSDPQLLASLARLAGGRVNPAPAALYDPTPGRGAAPRDLAGPLLWLALALLPLELAARRLPWDLLGGALERWSDRAVERWSGRAVERWSGKSIER